MSETESNGDGARVSNWRLYEAIQRLDRENEARYAELRSDVRSLAKDVQAIAQIQADHEARLRSVERWKLSVPISVLLALATIVGSIMTRGGGL